ncbi:MAG TPA: sugar transferase [Thermoanaerobaculia bacterium]|nr:sugar transferase [Thermoanaerobaculia bacterium]
MTRAPLGVRALRLAGDAAVALAALWLAFQLRIHFPLPFTEGLLPRDRLAFLFREWPAALAAQVACLYVFGFYDPPGRRSRPELARALAAAVALAGTALVAYLFFANRGFPRSVLLLWVLLDWLRLCAWRLALRRLGPVRERRVAIVGAGPAAAEIARAIALGSGHGLGVRVAGFVPTPEEEAAGMPAVAEPALGPRLGGHDDLPRLLADGRIDDLILAPSGESWQTRLVDRLAGTRPDHTNVLLLPGPFESLIGRMRYRWVHDLPLIEVVRESEWLINRPLKRLLDLGVGAALFVLALPLIGACALAVRLTSPGPVLYRQGRVGRGQRPFTLLKLRTMRLDAESATGEVLATAGDPRLTPIGALLRRYRLDELPQLWNVLAGEMSLVGPRPERPGFARRYLREVAGYAERFTLAPGLTGLAQVNGEYHSSPQNKLRYDLAYMANWSLWLDLSILLRTLKIVLTSRGV